MTTFLQWASILGAGAILAAYSFYRDHLEVKKMRQKAHEEQSRLPQQMRFAEQPHDSREPVLTR